MGVVWYSHVPRLNPPELNQYASDWPTANQNLSNTRAAVGSSINSSTVSKLGLAWSFPISVGTNQWGQATTNPLIAGNTVYFEDLESNVYALDFVTGKLLWKKVNNLDTRGPTGVALGYGKLYMIKGHYNVAALSLAGNELWSTSLSNSPDLCIDIQPVVYGNTVYVSTAPEPQGGDVGVIYGLDVQTGAIKMSFNTVDSADIWGNPKVNSGGGAWYPPAIDTATNVSYWGIGNPNPWPGTPEFPNGSSRPGPNLYTGSIVALNHADGKLLWYNQVVPHDLFDYDFQISPILASVQLNGTSRNFVFGAGKMGKVYAFDRKTGQTVWESSVGTHLNDTLKALPPGMTAVSPGSLGGVASVMAYADGILFVPVLNMVQWYTPSAYVDNLSHATKNTGELIALDAGTGNILWKNLFDSINVGAATVVNDLVFTATFDGKIYAFNTKTGKKAWEYQAPGGINGWPAVKGDSIIFPVGYGKSPVLLKFKLDSK